MIALEDVAPVIAHGHACCVPLFKSATFLSPRHLAATLGILLIVLLTRLLGFYSEYDYFFKGLSHRGAFDHFVGLFLNRVEENSPAADVKQHWSLYCCFESLSQDFSI